MKTQRLQIIVDGQEVLDSEVSPVELTVNTPWREIVSNPAMAAAMAGADPETLMRLPGETVAWHHEGSDLQLTVRFRWTAANGTITEFKPRG